MNTLHVVYRGGADAVRAVLADAAPADGVVEFVDPLNVGPLYDYDTGGAARATFWRELDEDESWREFQQQDLASANQIASHDGPVVVWHGPAAFEYLLALRVAYLLRDSQAPFAEVVRVSSRQDLPQFYDAVSLSGPSELAPLLRSSRAVTDRAHRASVWTSLTQDRSVLFRELAGTTVRELPGDAYDERILDACTDAWTDYRRVIGEVLVDTCVGDGVLSWRVRHLVRTGQLQTRGVGPLGPSEVKCSQPRAAP